MSNIMVSTAQVFPYIPLRHLACKQGKSCAVITTSAAMTLTLPPRLLSLPHLQSAYWSAKIFRNICLAIATLCPCAITSAEDIYVAQAAQGVADGSNAANAHPIAFFNTAANWSSPNKISGKIGPGDTVHLVGTVTSGLAFQMGGTPTAGVGTGPIKLLFEAGAVMTSPAWPNPNNATGAITVPNHFGVGLGYVIIDGGSNGVIMNTANGTSLASQVNSLGVALMETHDSIVQNLTIENLYVRPGPNPDGNGCGIGVKLFVNGGTQPASNDIVTHCTFHDQSEGFGIVYGKHWTNIEYSFCTVYNCNWGGHAGDSGSTASLTGLEVHDNNFHDFANWDDNSAANSHHHDGFYGWAVSGGTLRNVSYYNNLIGPNFGAHCSAGIYNSGDIGGILIYNNVFLENGASDKADDGLIFFFPNLGSTGTGYRVYNNTFIGGGAGTAINCSGGYGAALTTFDVKNNIASGVGTLIAVYYNGDSTLESDYNLLYNVSSAELVSSSPTSSAHFSTLQQWQALGYDTHSSTLNPNLDGSQVPQNPSGAIDRGTDLSAYFNTDIDGISRPQGEGWDIGASEYTPTGPVVTSAFNATGTQGASFSYDITATGSPTAFSASNLPPGLSVDSSTGVISGTPTAAGSFVVTIGTGSGSAFLSLNIIGVPPVISSPLSANGMVGAAFSYATAASFNPTTFKATGLPAGLSINATTGIVSGKPTTSGTFTIGLTATNAAGSGTATLTITISLATPVISGPFTVNAYKNQAFSYSIKASNSPTSFTASGLPSDLKLNTATGTISGTHTATGSFTISLTATNGVGTGNATLTINVVVATVPVISSPSSAAAVVDAPFTYTIQASNSPSSFTATGLPAGLALKSSTGVISGLPLTAGSYKATIGAVNSAGTGTATLTITVASVPPSRPVITSPLTIAASVNVYFSFTVVATNSPSSYSATGLPSGLYLNAETGVISGTPTTAGTSTVNLGAINGGGTGTSTLTITVAPAISKPSITSPAIATASVRAPFTYSIIASNSPTSYTATGLPNGLSLNTTTGVISGKPTTVGSSTVYLGAINAGGTGSSVLTLTVNSPAIGTAVSVTPNPPVAIQSASARLTNLSARATAGSGANVLITGFTISGGSKTLLIRGIGPALGALGVTNYLPDPELGLFSGGTEIQSNSGWGGDPALSDAFAQVGAFALNAGSHDSAILSTLAPGSFTAQVASSGDSTGVALAEIYDMETNTDDTGSRLTNISTRANVGAGANILIVGFTVGGSGEETVLVRGIGPTLNIFGVTGYLTNPVLTILDGSGNTVATNSAWGGTAALSKAFEQVGAFDLAPDSNDAALLLTLAPGSYTAQISGANGTTGVALAEIYEIP